MEYRAIGKTDIKVSVIGFGCWTMGGPNWSTSNGQSIGWADVNIDEVTAGIKAGLDAGVNHWDNADIYGNGKAERLLALCFARLGVDRSKQVIATKVGHFKGTAPHAYEPRHIRNQCEQSLHNLHTDYLDIYYFHHGTYVGPGYDEQPHDYLEEAAATMHALVKEGKVRAIGQSAYSDDDFERAVPVLRPDVLQNKANLRADDFIRPGSRCQALMEKYDCSYVAFGPLDQGILLDKFDPANPPAFEPGDYRTNRKDFNTQTLLAVREKLMQVRARLGSKAAPGSTQDIAFLSSVASRWLLAHPRVCSAIPGFRNAKQAACNVQAASDAPLAAADVAWLRDLFRA
ncbi:MAG: aldo/keto reductase [Planctomycetota bacterium]|nr:aldo/keto reductase [Planctomycetota bacterium]